MTRLTRPRIGPAVSSTHASATDQAAMMIGVYVIGPMLGLLGALLLVKP